eukprot:scaffold613274_cov19-Prasinocladus_malaysianus.AAC.1
MHFPELVLAAGASKLMWASTLSHKMAQGQAMEPSYKCKCAGYHDHIAAHIPKAHLHINNLCPSAAY